MVSDWENFLYEGGLISSALAVELFFFLDRYISISSFCVSSER